MLSFSRFALLTKSHVYDFLKTYDVSVPLRRASIIADFQKFKLPYAVAILIIPYLKYLCTTRIIALLGENLWRRSTIPYVKQLIKNMKQLGSGEMQDVWLELCFLNKYLTKVDRSSVYKDLSFESKAFLQTIIHKLYKTNTERFIDAYKEFSPEISTIERLRQLINSYYRRFTTAYTLSVAGLWLLALLWIQNLFNSYLYTIALSPLLFLSAYEFTNTILRRFVPARVTLSSNSRNYQATAHVAACIPFIVSQLQDLTRVKKEIQALRLANSSYPHVKYFVLVDFIDSFELDNAVYEQAQQIFKTICDELNAQYTQEEFFYFIRKSIYSERQQRYMGWERKRGKLVEFIKFLYHEETKSEILTNYSLDIPFKYIFTIDEGSEVSREIIQELLLRAENPANQPVIDEQTGSITQGFGVFQPKLSSKQDYNRTYFQKYFNRFEKYHTYTTSEDVTFSLWGDYYFQGKGLLNIEAYKTLCIDKFPDDVLLSHDLIEGNYLHVAYVDDCTIFESYPRGLTSYLQRVNRWMRGDINTILWLVPLLRKLSIDFGNNRVNMVTRFRILINILSIFKMPLILFAPLLLQTPFLGFFLAWMITQTTWFFELIREVINFMFKGHTFKFKLYLFRRRIDYWRIYEFFLIPFGAANAIHALLSSLNRLFITKKHTLTWVTSRRAEILAQDRPSRRFILMTGSMLLVIAFLNIVYGLFASLLVLASLVLSGFLSRQFTTKIPVETADQRYLRKIAKLTWNFFAKQVNKNTNYLPPDNITKEKVSGYTSITNIGFYFLSLICAHKLGIIKEVVFWRYFNKSFTTLTKLPMYRGHFYNWYNTKTLKVYPPHFLSSVDSGNFFGCMVCVRQYVAKLKKGTSYLYAIDKMLDEMKFEFFFNKYDQISIGYYTKKQLLSKENYDHFPSESRLAVYIAVARERVSHQAWGKMLRLFNANGALLSWGGTVFEYTLPHLFLKTYPLALNEYSFVHLLVENLRFGRSNGIPWGLSESLYLDEVTKTYEYKPIGISTLARDPLQIENRTAAPYATSLMLLIDVPRAVANFKALEELNMLTEYGFYEAVTFSKKRKATILKSHMSHHQGMLMSAVTNTLRPDFLVKLFNSYSTLGVVDYLLDEAVPDYPEITDERSRKFNFEE